jgi:hypothetical protein
VVTPVRDGGEAALPTPADPAVVKALARAYLGTLLRLTLLAPDIVEAVLDGTRPDGLGLPRLLAPFPGDWPLQRQVLTSGRSP